MTAPRADIKIRMTEPLRADIERAARRQGRSMNAEMIDRLQRTFDDDFCARIEKALRDLGERIDRLERQWLEAAE